MATTSFSQGNRSVACGETRLTALPARRLPDRTLRRSGEGVQALSGTRTRSGGTASLPGSALRSHRAIG